MKNARRRRREAAVAIVSDAIAQQVKVDAAVIFEREIANPKPEMADEAEAFMRALEAGTL